MQKANDVNRQHFQKRYLSAILIAVAVVFIFVWLTEPEKEEQPAIIKIDRKVQDKEDFEDAGFEKNGRWYGLCEKNSVHSISDLRNIVERDPVLKEHFSGFKWEHAKMGKLDRAISAYVHFRKNNLIVLKKNPIQLPAGDEFITDGSTNVRTQCCNTYSESAPAAQAPESTDPPGTLSQKMMNTVRQMPSLALESLEDPTAFLEARSREPISPSEHAHTSVTANPPTPETRPGFYPITDPRRHLAVVSDPPLPNTLEYPPGEIVPEPDREEDPPGEVIPVPEPTIIMVFGICIPLCLLFAKTGRSGKDA